MSLMGGVCALDRPDRSACSARSWGKFPRLQQRQPEGHRGGGRSGVGLNAIGSRHGLDGVHGIAQHVVVDRGDEFEFGAHAELSAGQGGQRLFSVPHGVRPEQFITQAPPA
jgi:hypothetical protein